MTQELDKLLKDAKAGKKVKEDDIPPQVFVKGVVATSSEPAEMQSKQDDSAIGKNQAEKQTVTGNHFMFTCVCSDFLLQFVCCN